MANEGLEYKDAALRAAHCWFGVDRVAPVGRLIDGKAGRFVRRTEFHKQVGR